MGLLQGGLRPAFHQQQVVRSLGGEEVVVLYVARLGQGIGADAQSAQGLVEFVPQNNPRLRVGRELDGGLSAVRIAARVNAAVPPVCGIFPIADRAAVPRVSRVVFGRAGGNGRPCLRRRRAAGGCRDRGFERR